ncbi:MAG: hypothetical protein JWN44_1848 [Myxococcales bacterium]|nr:hypothetical protein [Myxococcales bacterium]
MAHRRHAMKSDAESNPESSSPSPEERRRVLERRRDLKMARSAHAYVRGSTERFYQWLLSSARVALPNGPEVWICGDCHVGNLGPLGRCEGAAVVELRDLDQASISNPAFDLVRLALSLAMAARSSDLPGVTTARMTENLIVGYADAFAGATPDERAAELPQPIRLVMKRAIKRTWRHLFDERLGEGPRHELPLGARFWRLSDDECDAVKAIVGEESVRRLVTALESRDDDADVAFVDAAYWVKGCSSLGLWRAAVLVEVGRKKKDRKICLLDIKEATETCAPTVSPAELPRHHGERVVAGARALAPALGERVVASTLLGKPVFVRELLPQDLKVELDELSAEEGRAVAHYFGLVVGRAHARQLDDAQRAAWMQEILSHRTKNIDAPSWLWQSVVDLVALHERAYLEHCRHYALDAAPR